MEVYQSRLETFSKAKRVKHSTSKRAATIKWPHSDSIRATPDALAEAGFYWNPTWDERDNVACYLCGKELSGWDPDDDPLLIHYDKCADTCAWATLRCGLPTDQDRKGRCAIKLFDKGVIA
jgi:baculoviral IAP repeat-containing protein 5